MLTVWRSFLCVAAFTVGCGSRVVSFEQATGGASGSTGSGGSTTGAGGSAGGGGSSGAAGFGVDAGSLPTRFDVLADFEVDLTFNRNPLWSGGFAADSDRAAASLPQLARAALTPPRANPPPAGAPSWSAARMSDAGFHTIWGTVLYADLQNSSKAVDLTRYAGISLWARSTGAVDVLVKVALPDYGSYPQVDTVQFPQLCDPLDTAADGRSCYDDYAVKIVPDASWRRYDIPFSSLATEGWGFPHAFDQSRVYRIKISMLPGAVYDLWFDDIAFYETD